MLVWFPSRHTCMFTHIQSFIHTSNCSDEWNLAPARHIIFFYILHWFLRTGWALGGLAHTCPPLHGRRWAVISEAFPEDYLGAELLILILADPGRAEGGQVGEHCPSGPHREVPVLWARHPHAFSQVRGHHLSELTLKPFRQTCQQGIATFSNNTEGGEQGDFFFFFFFKHCSQNK